MLSALIFDFDGIIVDTEPLHYQAFQRILDPLGLGYSWDDYVASYMGFDDRDAFLEAFRGHHGPLSPKELEQLIDRKASVFQEIIADGVPAYPGVVELIREASSRLPVALCSGALPSDIEPILASLGLSGAFPVRVTAADVSASKPDPASYRLALGRLQELFPNHGIMPERSLAIEDTPAGIASATGAGIAVLAVTNSYPAASLGSALRVVDSLAGLSLENLESLLSPR